MSEYHKINTCFKRDMASKNKTLIVGEWAEDEFEYLKDNRWVFTEKVDGTNIRIIYHGDGTFSHGGRTDDAMIPVHFQKALNNVTTGQKLQAVFGENKAVIYGEGYGAKIQNGGKYRQDCGFVAFDVRVGAWWLYRHDVEDVAEKLGLEIVPIIGVGTLFDAIAMAQQGFKSTWGNFESEGIVARPKVELKNRKGHRIIPKIKCKDFRGTECHSHPNLAPTPTGVAKP